MSDKEVAKFMVGISLDATALQRFHRDPDAEIARFGLSPDSAAIVKSRDSVAISKAITTNFGSRAADADVVNVVVVVLP